MQAIALSHDSLFKNSQLDLHCIIQLEFRLKVILLFHLEKIRRLIEFFVASLISVLNAHKELLKE